MASKCLKTLLRQSSTRPKTVSLLQCNPIRTFTSATASLSALEADSALQKALNLYGAQKPTQMSLKQMSEFGKDISRERVLHSASFLHHELRTRLAVMAKQLVALPDGLNAVPHVKEVYGWYLQSLSDLLPHSEPKSWEEAKVFADVIEKIKRRHDRVMEHIALGLQEWKEIKRGDVMDARIQEALDRYFMARISIRVLIGHQVAMHQQAEKGKTWHPSWVGIISQDMKLYDVAEAAATTAQDLCRNTYGDTPAVEILGDHNASLTYLPTHLSHILIELLKNSLRAVIEKHGDKYEMPPVRIVLASGREDVSVKVSDEGGGIARSQLPKIWGYTYTTASQMSKEAKAMAGYGFGLPLSRLYARYMNGDLQVLSMEGYGTAAFIHLGKLENHREKLYGVNIIGWKALK